MLGIKFDELWLGETPMRQIMFACVAALAIAAPAMADPQDGRLYQDQDQLDQDEGQSKSGKWYGGARQGFDNHDRLGGYFEGRKGFEHHINRRGFEDRRENWLDGEAFALLDRWALWHFDSDRDGRLNRREYETSQRSFWGAADRNRDGRVTNNEYGYFRDRYLRRDFNRGYTNGWHNGWRW
jgi:hypothetical protein